MSKWMLLMLFIFVINWAVPLFVEGLGAKIEVSLSYSWTPFAVQIISLLEVKKSLQ